jgi:GT2 family glycosyltransferase
MVQRKFPSVRFVQCPDNVGFARANNLGAESAQGEFLLFLNPDTEVHDNAIAALLQHGRSLAGAGIVGPKLKNTDRSLQASCVQVMPTILNQLLDLEVFQRWFPRHRLWTTAARFEGLDNPVVVEAMSGACVLMRRVLFEDVGGFSPDYFMYAEDLDLAWKVRNAGWLTYYVPSCEVVHHGGGSTQYGRSHFSEVMVPESVSRLLRKTHGRTYSFSYRLALSGAALLRLVLIALSFPVGFVMNRTRHWKTMFRKWVAVLRWGLGMETWVKRYGVPD